MKIRWHILVAVLIITSLVVGPAASSPLTWTITGTVTDVLGTPLEGARVDDGARSVVTDENGRYTLVENSPSNYRVSAGKNGYVSRGKNVDVLTNTGDVDFDLPFDLNRSLNPVYFNEVPQTITARAWSLAPATTEVTARLPDASIITLDYHGEVDGRNLWTSTFMVSDDAADRTYDVFFLGKIDGTPVTNESSYIYVLDRVNPSLSDPAAEPHGSNYLATRSSTPRLRAIAQDDRAQIGSSGVQVEIAEASGSLVLTGSGTYAKGEASYTVSSLDALPDGTYTATFTVTDKAGNASSLSFSFDVDTSVPTASSTFPTGTTSSLKPTITAALSDEGGPARIDVSSIVITISRGPLVISDSPNYDTTTGEVSYTPPLLPDGEYQALLEFDDVAGNEGSISWTFETRSVP